MAPGLTLPRGGGAIRGIGEKFAANPVTGTGRVSVPIAVSPGRSGFGPQLLLDYDSGAGNGPFGLGWHLSLPSITRKTDKGLPQYRDTVESDVFVLSGAEDLVPVLQRGKDGEWIRERPPLRKVGGVSYRIDRYRPRVEGLFARIERWTNTVDATDVFWRSISRDNVGTWYGRTVQSRIADPGDPSRIFSWLICESHDNKGNAIVYTYRPEDSVGIFDPGDGSTQVKAHERNRTEASRSAQRYLKRIRYGNRHPYIPAWLEDAPWPEPVDALAPDGSDTWMFEAVLDYGEHAAQSPAPNDAEAWPVRVDPFSSFRPGFELRTYRRCRRVLMFHHFPSEVDVGRNCLVRSTELHYSQQAGAVQAPLTAYTMLLSITQTGHRRGAGGYDSSSLPPIEFGYSEPVMHAAIEDVDPSSLENLPLGLDGRSYRWADLHGEGIPGILSEQGGTWYYKRNLSPLVDGGVDKVRFSVLEVVAPRPNASLSNGAEFLDLAGDGRPDLVLMEGPTAGLYEHDEAEGWHAFRPFVSRLNRDLSDPNLKFIDLDGDGRADVLITEHEAFVWHASLAEDGFGPAQRVVHSLDEEKGPRIVFADASQAIHLADLSGDGLTDIVRIRNGEVCYWPNLGHGRFGAKVSMDNAPWFDHADQFEHARIRLADIDGSGTTDILYLHRDGVRLYFNQSGNSWSATQTLPVFPRIDELASIVPVDLLGNGTACLVWSSGLAGDARRPMRYVKLMGDRKPHLLVSTVNNLGAETHIDYAPSTRFYLQDKRDGRPWRTHLPFPVHVVERVETIDHVSRGRFVTRYAYHHGHFDADEREFGGFGMVEQWDTERFEVLAARGPVADNIASESHVPAIRTRRWYHTGVHGAQHEVADFFAGDLAAGATLLSDAALPPSLNPDEAREASRALRGSLLREEVYADDAGPAASPEQIARARTPYNIIEQSFAVRMLQPRAALRHGVFFTHAGETITRHCERHASDPRILHALTLQVDAHGNVLKRADVAYGRREWIHVADASGQAQQLPNPGLAELPVADRIRQTKSLLIYTESAVTNAVVEVDAHRIPQLCETRTFELTGFAVTGPSGCFQAADLVEADAADPASLRQRFDAPEIAYEQAASGDRRRRCIEWQRTLYRRDDLADLLPLGELQALALPGERYQLAFTPGLLTQVFQRMGEALLPDAVAVLGSEGGYVQANGAWWIPSGRSFFSADPGDDAATELAQARQHFFVSRRHRDAFGQSGFVDFDSHDLLIAETRDALDNRIVAEANDYRVLQPRRVSDPNRNYTEVAFDALGMVVGSAVMGKQANATGDTLAGFVSDPAAAERSALFDGADPHAAAEALLHGASQRIVYDLDRFRRTKQANPDDPSQWQPSCAATLARETHVGAALPAHGLRIQLDFAYTDGFGREVQKRNHAAPGPLNEGGPVLAERWIASGWTIFNNKGKPVRRFEPFFSDTRRFEFGVQAGVSPVLFYDPAERVVATLHPNRTYEKVVFDAWQQTTWDVNDTCAARNAQTGDPRIDPDIAGHVAGHFQAMGAAAAGWQTWHAERIAGGLGVHERHAALRAQAHADTPTTVHLDPLGRTVLTVQRNRVVCAGHDLDGTEESCVTRVDLDIEGNQCVLRDERKQPVDDLPVGALEQRVVMRRSFDMLGRCIHQASMEAGARWMLNDASGKPIRTWDSRGHRVIMQYDALRRQITQTVRGSTAASDPRTFGRDIQFDRIEYGESLINADALNLRTRIYRHFDAAGVLVHARLDADSVPIAAFDARGNLLHATRRLARDPRALPDWSKAAEPQLEIEAFEASTRYDALDRAIQSLAPRSSLGAGGAPAKFHVVQPVFDEGRLLQRVDVWLEQATAPTGLLDPAGQPASPVGVAAIHYDAKGQRQRIVYQNGADTSYSHDPLTFRLTRLVTRRDPAAFAGDDDAALSATGWPGRLVQNLGYTYDPAGNITHIQDDAQQAVYFRNQRVEPSNDHTYDAIYRLIESSGREHLGQGVPTPSDASDALRTRVGHPGDGNAMGRYVERFVHDTAGNLLQMQHRGSDPVHRGWTRAFACLETSLIEDGSDGTPAVTSNRLSRSTLNPGGAAPVVEAYRHDIHGNMVRMPLLGGGPDPNMHWDHQDRLFRMDLGGGGTAHYVYDAAGQRVRKLWEKSPGLIEERIYLGGFEIFRKHKPGGITTLERETLHVMDDRQRIALVETRTLDTAGDDAAPRQLIRYQLGNHLGSASLELDERAHVVSYEEHSPYGSSTYQAVRSQTDTAKRYRFTGKERDEESGLCYHGARYYAPWLGRWTACDPAGLEDGSNLFSYVRNRPTTHMDPTGRIGESTKQALHGLQKFANEIPQHEFKELSRSEQGTRAHLTLESMLRLDPHSPAKVPGGWILAPEMIVDAKGVVAGFGEPGQFSRAMKDGRSIDVALLKEPVLDLKSLVGQRASDVVQAGVDYKTGKAKLSGVKHMQSLLGAPVVGLWKDRDVVAALEKKLPTESIGPSQALGSVSKAAAAAPNRWAGALASAGKVLSSAARIAGQVATVVGAGNEAQKTVISERQRGRSEASAALAGTVTFVAGVAAGIVDDAFATFEISRTGAPSITMDAWDRGGAGPFQQMTGQAIRDVLGWGFKHGL